MQHPIQPLIQQALSRTGFEAAVSAPLLTGFDDDQLIDFHIGLVITTWNRPEYLQKTFASLARSSLEDCLVIIIDDHSDEKRTRQLVADVELGAPTIRLSKYQRSGFHISLDIGWSLLHGLGCNVLSNLDSDTLVKPDWLSALIRLREKIHCRADRLILSGFNRHNKPSVLSDGPDHVVKSRMGGINYFFDATAFSTIKPFLTHPHWDSEIQDHFEANQADHFMLVACKPSVVQHIGRHGTNSHHVFDYATDFDSPDSGAPKFVVSRRHTGLGDCLVNLFSAWLYARATDRELIIDWRFSHYREGDPVNLFTQLFQVPEFIDGVRIHAGFREHSDTVSLTVFPPDRDVQQINPPGLMEPHNWDAERMRMLNLIRFGQDRDEKVVVFDHCLNWDEMLFSSTSRRFFEQLNPLKAMQTKIDRFSRDNFENLPVVGIHVRHGNGSNIMDHGKYWTESALERCAAAISHARASINQPCHLFLATDSIEVESYLGAVFPDLISYQKFLGKAGEGELHHVDHGKQVPEDALLEMYLLARVDVLIRFPAGSFFSRVSAQLRHSRYPVPEQARLSLENWASIRRRFDPVMDFGDGFNPVSCLITFRDDRRERLQNLYFVLEQLSADPELEIILVEQDSRPVVDATSLPGACKYQFVHNSGSFNKSWGLNIAASLSAGEVLVVHDADMLLDNDALRQAARQIDPGIDVVSPYDMLIDLDRQETASLIQGDPALEISRTADQVNRFYRGQSPPLCGGIFVIRREFFYGIGGMDERFTGWGGEDDAMTFRVKGNSARIHWMEGQVAHHLWHHNGTASKGYHSPQYIRNIALLSAYHENGQALLKDYRHDLDGNGDPEKYSPSRHVDCSPVLPLVSCLCITRARVPFLRNAIDCFEKQTYVNRELLILCDDDDQQTSDFVKALENTRIRLHVVATDPRMNLGQLRNLSVELAVGEYFCQWDDDDWFSPERISRQMAFARQAGKAASILPRWQIYSAPDDRAFLSNMRLWEGSVLSRKDAFSGGRIYLESGRGEEAPMVRTLLQADQLAVVDCPELYIYRYTGANTWGAGHFQKILSMSTALDGDAARDISAKMTCDTGRQSSVRIPKIIHQTAATADLPEELHRWQRIVMALHPEWQYCFYDNRQCRQLVAEKMPELLVIYDRLPKDIQRVDLFRLVAVYLFGGFYIDLDMELKRKLDPLIGHRCVFAEEVTLSEGRRLDLDHTHALRVANYLFAATPRDPFVGRLIVAITERALEREVADEDHVRETTGPAMVTAEYHRYSHRQQVTLLENNKNRCSRCGTDSCAFGDFAIHHHRGSGRWQQPSAESPGHTDPVKIIHQTWKSAQLPGLFQRFANTWKSNHPHWQYCLWTDQDNRQLIEKHYPWFLDTYDSYPENIQRADAARYFILYTIGGLYIDLDFRCFRSIETLIDPSRVTLGLENPVHSELHGREKLTGNAFMFAPAPGNPFLRRVIEELAQPLSALENGNDQVLESTGPFMLTRIYEDYEDKASIKLVLSDDLYPLDYLSAEALLSNPRDDARFARTTRAFAAHYHCGSWWKSSPQLD